MRYTKTSWFPLCNFTKKGCHRDWMLGVGKWKGIKDSLTGSKIKVMETVFWNRSLGNITISLENYMKNKEIDTYLKKLEEMGLPDDIKVM